jgi:hypothetical protein
LQDSFTNQSYPAPCDQTDIVTCGVANSVWETGVKGPLRSDCTHFIGSELRWNSGDVSTLPPNLYYIDGDLTVDNMDNSMNFTGAFANLVYVMESFQIEYNHFTSLHWSSSQGPQYINYGFRINNNDNLQHVTGFEAVTYIAGSVRFSSNPVLESVGLVTNPILNNVSVIGADFELDGTYDTLPNLRYVNGFENLVMIGDDFYVEETPRMDSMPVFPKLEYVDGDFAIANTGLTSANDVFPELKFAWTFDIYKNRKLEQLTGFNHLRHVNGYMNLGNMKSLTEIPEFDSLEFAMRLKMRKLNLTDISGFNSLIHLERFKLTDFNVTEISGFNALLNVRSEPIIDDDENVAMLGFQSLPAFYADHSAQEPNFK